MVFFNYTAETWSKMISTPSDRLAAVRDMAQTVGGDVESLYFMFGAKDGLLPKMPAVRNLRWARPR